MKKMITVGEVKELLQLNKKIKVKSKNDVFFNISNFVEKGILDTYQIIMDNNFSIKVSREHKFYSEEGWVMMKDLLIDSHTLLLEDNKFHKIKSIQYVGKNRIVDITVDDDSHAYFGNGFLNHNTGKSLVAAHILKETQKKNGVAVLIDTEAAISRGFLEAIGVELSGPNRLMVIPAETIETIFKTMETIINTVRNQSKDRLVTIVVDSLSGASTNIEMDADYEKTGYATSKALLLSQAMRKITNLIAKERICVIFTNQYRMKMDAMAFGDKYTTSGGMAVKYHASVRVEFANMGALKKKDSAGIDIQIGNKVQAKIKKNRMGPPARKTQFNIFYDSGIDNYSGWLDVLKSYDVIKQGGAYYTYNEEKFMSKDFADMLAKSPALYDDLYSKLCDIMIMKYKTNGAVQTDESVQVDEEDLSGFE